MSRKLPDLPKPAKTAEQELGEQVASLRDRMLAAEFHVKQLTERLNALAAKVRQCFPD